MWSLLWFQGKWDFIAYLYNLFNNPPSGLFLCNFETIPSKSSVRQCAWKQEDFSIKLNLAKGEDDSNEHMELKYGRWGKQWKVVENEFGLRNRRASKNEVTWSFVFQSITFLKNDCSLTPSPSEAGVLAVLIRVSRLLDTPLSLPLGTPSPTLPTYFSSSGVTSTRPTLASVSPMSVVHSDLHKHFIQPSITYFYLLYSNYKMHMLLRR